MGIRARAVDHVRALSRRLLELGVPVDRVRAEPELGRGRRRSTCATSAASSGSRPSGSRATAADTCRSCAARSSAGSGAAPSGWSPRRTRSSSASTSARSTPSVMLGYPGQRLVLPAAGGPRGPAVGPVGLDPRRDVAPARPVRDDEPRRARATAAASRTSSTPTTSCCSRATSSARRSSCRSGRARASGSSGQRREILEYLAGEARRALREGRDVPLDGRGLSRPGREPRLRRPGLVRRPRRGDRAIRSAWSIARPRRRRSTKTRSTSTRARSITSRSSTGTGGGRTRGARPSTITPTPRSSPRSGSCTEDARAESPLGIEGRGDVHVTTLATMFKRIRFYTHESLDAGKITLPPEELDTTAFWIVLSEALDGAAAAARRDAGRARSPGVATLLRGLAPLYLRCSPRDLRVEGRDAERAGSASRRSSSTRALPQGIGLSEAMFERRRDLYLRGRGARAAVRVLDGLSGVHRAQSRRPGREGRRDRARRPRSERRALRRRPRRPAAATGGGHEREPARAAARPESRGRAGAAAAGRRRVRSAGDRFPGRVEALGAGRGPRRGVARPASAPARGVDSRCARSDGARSRRPRRRATRGSARSIRPSWLFIDTETTSLNSGAGVWVFMVGLGWFEGRRVPRAAVLPVRPGGRARAARDRPCGAIAAAGAVVSFHGKSFDAPRLDDRFRLVGLEPVLVGPAAPRPPAPDAAAVRAWPARTAGSGRSRSSCSGSAASTICPGRSVRRRTSRTCVAGRTGSPTSSSTTGSTCCR